MVLLLRRKLFLILLAKLEPDLAPSELRLSSLVVAPLPLLGLNHVENLSDSLPTPQFIFLRVQHCKLDY
jgi:hypothetical protein